MSTKVNRCRKFISYTTADSKVVEGKSRICVQLDQTLRQNRILTALSLATISNRSSFLKPKDLQSYLSACGFDYTKWDITYTLGRLFNMGLVLEVDGGYTVPRNVLKLWKAIEVEWLCTNKPSRRKK